MEQPYSETNAGLHYDLRLEVNPRTSYVSVSGSLAYHSPANRVERARFYLHRQFTIHRLEGRRVLGYHFETSAEQPAPFLTEAGVLDVYFDPPLKNRETTLISFAYDGRITGWPAESANVIMPQWAELGMYLPWFPFQYDGAKSDLTFTLKVTAPAGYQVSSYGPAVYQDGASLFTWMHPTSDIVVAVGSSLTSRVLESDTNRVFLASSTLSEAAAVRLGEELLWTLERFSGWFGPTRPADFTLIESPRTLGGGYARRGLVVISGINERAMLEQGDEILRYLAHEAAHAWWWEAPTNTWEDWLNESFAEYAALLAVRERYGVESYERLLHGKREHILASRAVWEFDRADTTTPEKQTMVERMLYDKGPLILHELAGRIGNNRFLELCRARLWSGVTTTAHLLDLLEELEDAATRRWLEERLKQEAPKP